MTEATLRDSLDSSPAALSCFSAQACLDLEVTVLRAFTEQLVGSGHTWLGPWSGWKPQAVVPQSGLLACLTTWKQRLLGPWQAPHGWAPLRPSSLQLHAFLLDVVSRLSMLEKAGGKGCSRPGFPGAAPGASASAQLPSGHHSHAGATALQPRHVAPLSSRRRSMSWLLHDAAGSEAPILGRPSVRAASASVAGALGSRRFLTQKREVSFAGRAPGA